MLIEEFLASRIAEDVESSLGVAYIERDKHLSAYLKLQKQLLELHKNWPVLVETKPIYEQHTSPTNANEIVYRMTQRQEWLTTQEYIQKFGTDPPTSPIIRTLLELYRDHPDFDPEWLA